MHQSWNSDPTTHRLPELNNQPIFCYIQNLSSVINRQVTPSTITNVQALNLHANCYFWSHGYKTGSIQLILRYMRGLRIWMVSLVNLLILIFWIQRDSVRTNLTNRPTKSMLVCYIAQYTKLSGNCGSLRSGLGQTTPVYVGITYGSGRSIIWVGYNERLR